VRKEKGKCHCPFEWCVCIWFVNFEFCQRVITGQQAFYLSCHVKGQTCHSLPVTVTSLGLTILLFINELIVWLINETVRFSCDFWKTAMDDIYTYNFSKQKGFWWRGHWNKLSSWYHCHHSIFSKRWGRMLGALKAIVFNYIMSRLEW
jgi:hypothetical protein